MTLLKVQSTSDAIQKYMTALKARREFFGYQYFRPIFIAGGFPTSRPKISETSGKFFLFIGESTECQSKIWFYREMRFNRITEEDEEDKMNK